MYLLLQIVFAIKNTQICLLLAFFRRGAVVFKRQVQVTPKRREVFAQRQRHFPED